MSHIEQLAIANKLSELTGIPNVFDWNSVGNEEETVELFDKQDNLIGKTTVEKLDAAVWVCEG